MAGLWGNIEDDEPVGLLGGLQRGIGNPMTLAGLGLLTGGGWDAARQGMAMGTGFEQMRLADQQRRQYQGLLQDPSVTGAIPAPLLKVAQMAGPSGGPEVLAKFLDPAREADLELKKAQIAKIQRDNALASEAAARQKALYNAFMAPSAGSAPEPAPVPASSEPVSPGAARFAAPGLVAPTAATPQTPQDIFNALPPNKKAQAQLALASGDMKEFTKIIGEGPPQLADNLTPGEKRVDQTFAKSYEDFVLSGGAADFDKNLDQLRGVQREMTRPGGDNLTGPVLGRMPDAITAFTNPKAVDARQRVEEVVQRNLRIILGAQFTQKEGENLIARAYNPALDEATNAKRLGRLISSMEKMKEAKLKAMDYFEKHGTMKGFRGSTQFNVNDLLADLDAPEQRDSGGANRVRTYNPQNGRLE